MSPPAAPASTSRVSAVMTWTIPLGRAALVGLAPRLDVTQTQAIIALTVFFLVVLAVVVALVGRWLRPGVITGLVGTVILVLAILGLSGLVIPLLMGVVESWGSGK